MSKATASNAVHGPPQHEVFINFRGIELRGGFISHLVKGLKKESINVFIDNDQVTGSDLSIFLKRIEQSRIVISVISSKFTESKWCLNELEKVIECVEAGNLEVFPVFYKVDVNTVKEQRGNFGDQLKDLTKLYPAKAEPWKHALEFVCEKKGVVVNETSDESLIVEKIAEDVMDVMRKLKEMDQGTKSPRGDIIEVSNGQLEGESESSSSKAFPFFGIETRLKQLKEKFCFESNEVTQIVAIVGMPGIGKTSLAKKLFEDWRGNFLHTMFLDDVREKSKSLGIHRLKEDLLYGLNRSKYGANDLKTVGSSLKSLNDELRESKVFIVLDDVSKKNQIEEILGGREWLRDGSKIVITTNSNSVVEGVADETYLVPGLSDTDALDYFKRHAFSGSCEPSFTKLAKEFVDYSRGHPLSLKVLGNELRGRQMAYWESVLGTLAKSPINTTIQNVLRIPYDDLSKHHQDLFLDVACFFRFDDEYHARSLLDSSVHENVSEIKDLADKFLINICGGRLEINDLMYTFAMGLESQSSTENSTSGRRLSNHGDIITVLRNKAEATKVRGIFLDMSEVQKKMSLGSDTFKEMNDLRYLKFFNSSCPKECEGECNLKFPNGLKFTLEEIRYFHWLKFPHKNFPRDFNPKNLIDLKLPYSQIEQVWEGEKDTSKLKWLDMNHSRNLHTLSGLSLARKLQSLNLEGCTKLKMVHEELRNMESLVFLNLRGCTSLESLSALNLISLKTLILSGCSNLDEIDLNSKNLEELYLDGTAIKKLPSEIGDHKRLVLLKLKDCKKLLSLPDSIGNLEALEKLILSGCSKLTSFPEVRQNLKHLKTLRLDGTGIKEMHDIVNPLSINHLRIWPHDINRISSVQRLCLSRNDFRSLPGNIINLYNLKWLDLKYCKQLTSLPKLPPNLHWLDAHGCISLKKIENPLSLLSAATEHSHSTFIFTNCTKLDQVAKNSIVSYIRRKIQFMSDALVHQDKGSILDVLIKICYPGWQLPVWFNHRSVGSELKQNLPRHWHEDGLTGIALCVVVSSKDHQDHNTRLLVRCTGEFKEKDEPLMKFSCVLGGWTKHTSDKPQDTMESMKKGKEKEKDTIESSGHVFIGYINLLHIMKRDRGVKCVATEVSLNFEVTDGAKQVTNCEVLKCGFTLIYAPTKHVHSLCSEVYSNHDDGTGANSVPGVAPMMKSEIRKEVQSEANSDASSSRRKLDANADIDESMSPVSPAEGEVVNDESPKKDDTNQGGATSSTVSSEDTVDDDNGTNNLSERLEKPIWLICLVIAIYAGAAFVLGKNNRKR